MCVSYFCYALASSHDPAAQKADLISFYKNQTCSVPVHTHLIDTAINEALFRQKKLYFNIPLLKRIPVNAPHTYAQDYKTVHKPCIRENEKKKKHAWFIFTLFSASKKKNMWTECYKSCHHPGGEDKVWKQTRVYVLQYRDFDPSRVFSFFNLV